MKRIIFNEYGGPEVFSIQDFELPEIKEGQILINQSGTSINPVDIKVRKGDLKFLTGRKFPKTFGSDFCGEVVQSKNRSYSVGDFVFGALDTLKGNAYAEKIISDGTNCTIKPVNLSEYEAAVTPVIGITCYMALISHGDVQKTRRVFINGCTGGVGHFAVKMAKALEAEVTGTCSEKNIGLASSIGVDHVLDYNKPFPQNILKSFDFVFDTTGKLSVSGLKRFGNKNAKYCTTGFKPEFFFYSVLSKSFKFIKFSAPVELLNNLKNFIEKNKIKPLISGEWPMNEVGKAQEEFEKGNKTGKVLIRIK